MNINTYVTIKCLCYKLKENQDYNNYKSNSKETLEFKLNNSNLRKFLFRIEDNKFAIENYNIILQINNIGRLVSFIIKDQKTNSIYIPVYFDNFIQEVEQSYIRIKTIDKLNNLLEYDFNTISNKIDEDGLLDEFDIEENKS